MIYVENWCSFILGNMPKPLEILIYSLDIITVSRTFNRYWLLQIVKLNTKLKQLRLQNEVTNFDKNIGHKLKRRSTFKNFCYMIFFSIHISKSQNAKFRKITLKIIVIPNNIKNNIENFLKRGL